MFKSKSSRAACRAAKQLRLQQQQQQESQEQPVAKQDYLENCLRTYSCIHCRAHLANHDELLSKLFQGNEGRAYLFNKVTNVGCKQAVERQLLTGLHAVADIYCDSCETTLGWKYEQAFVPSQKYKEGKYIIELVHMLKENNWDLTSYNTRDLIEQANQTRPGGGCVEWRRAKLSMSSLDDNFGIGAGAGAGASSSNLNASSDRRATRRRTSEGDNRKRRHISNVTENSEQIALETSDNKTIRTTTTTPNTLDNNPNNLTSESLDVIRDVVELSTQRSNKQMAHNHNHHQHHNHQTSNQRQYSTIAAYSINDNNRQLHAIDMSTITPPDGLELVERSLSRLQLESGQDNNRNDQRHPSTATLMISGQSLSASPKSSSTSSTCSSRSPSDMSSCSSGAPGESGRNQN